MDVLDTEVSGVRLTPYFQPYLLLDDPERVTGEILSKPDVSRQTEEFFTSLSVDDQFDILAWQIRLQHVMHDHMGAHVSINVHNRVVETEEARARFLDLVAQASAPTTFEFTETYPMPPVGASNHLLRDIRTLGHASALDDFGTGLNGMSLLTDYDFDIIKLDRSLVFDLPSRAEKRKTLRLVREMLQVLGKAHIVEGVETDEVLDILKELGFRSFQGYYCGMPAPLASLVAPPTEGALS
ncbi:MAG: EAL domain-containing protein [Candidatus Nanopelagicales bacterium]